MTSYTKYVVESFALDQQAQRYEDMAAGLYGFGGRAREMQQGPFLEPLEGSISRALDELVSAGTALRTVAAECSRRAGLISEHRIAVSIWEFNRPDDPREWTPGPQWSHEWSYQ